MVDKQFSYAWNAGVVGNEAFNLVSNYVRKKHFIVSRDKNVNQWIEINNHSHM